MNSGKNNTMKSQNDIWALRSVPSGLFVQIVGGVIATLLGTWILGLTTPTSSSPVSATQGGSSTIQQTEVSSNNQPVFNQFARDLRNWGASLSSDRINQNLFIMVNLSFLGLLLLLPVGMIVVFIALAEGPPRILRFYKNTVIILLLIMLFSVCVVAIRILASIFTQ